ncbi:MAG: putative nuclease SbcCD subunit C [Chloroflexi bacterium OLB15]|nr:MAG: putative nuclease SbcCD subunit C [Chloroflexi bacterium OLB15]
MLPKRLELKNFLAYQSPNPLVFEGIHLACLTGPNGAGKSSLLDAITWALWGKARASREEELIHHGETEMVVQFDFEQDGIDYRVIRKRTKKGGGSGTLDLFVFDPETGLREMTEPSKSATQAKIERLLRMSYETFVHSAFLQQGKADSFTALRPTERKKVLGEILELDRWIAYEDGAKAELSRIKDDLTQIDARILDIDSELQQESVLNREREDAETAHNEAKQALAAAQARFDEVQHVPNALKMKREQIATSQQAQKRYQGDLEAVAKEIERQRGRIADLEAVTAAQMQIEAGYQTLQAARADDQELGVKLSALTDLQQRRSTLEAQLTSERGAIQQDIARLEADIAAYNREIAAADTAEYERLRAEIITLDLKTQEKDACDAERQQAENQVTALKTSNDRIVPDSQKLRERINRLKEAEGGECPLCGQPLTEEHRDQMAEELEADGRRMKAEHQENSQQIEALTARIKQLRDRVNNLAGEIKRGEIARKNEAVLKNAIEKAEVASEKRDTAQANRDALLATLESENFGAELRAQIAALDDEREGLGYDKESHDKARKSLSEYGDYESRHQQLQGALAALPDAQRLLQNILERESRLQQELAKETDRLGTLNLEFNALTAQEIEFNQRRDAVERFGIAERTANNRLVTANQKLNVLQAQRQRKEKLEAQRDGLREARSLYEELREAFGKNGIPAMIIESALPELEDNANRLLGAMTDGRMTLRLNTQREKVTGGVQETLLLDISDELGTRSYDMYSGGEAFRINFALRVALSQLLARRAGAQLRTLFIDEGFGTQDEDGRAKLVDAITRIQNKFDLILVITHIDELRDSFPVHVQVEKTRNGSLLSLR